MRAFPLLILQCVILLLAAETVRADVVIQYTGCYNGAGTTAETNEAANWLDKAVVKSFDGDGDNRYGTSGFLQVVYAGSWNVTWPGNQGNWAWGGSGGQISNGAWYPVNDARVNIDNNPGSRTVQATLCANTSFTGLRALKDYSHIRIGIMNDVLNGSDAYGNNTKLECRD